MQSFTNLAWPADPFGTTQRPFVKSSEMLTSIAVKDCGQCDCLHPIAVAISYLRLHRKRPISVRESTFNFGFYAVSMRLKEEASDLLRLVDEELTRARRHAKILAGHMIPSTLSTLRRAAPNQHARGVEAVERAWPDRHEPARGLARLIDVALDVPNCLDLRDGCREVNLSLPSIKHALHVPFPDDMGGETFHEGTSLEAEQWLPAAAIEYALVVGLVAAKWLGVYAWDDELNIHSIMAASAWDCVPLLPLM